MAQTTPPTPGDHTLRSIKETLESLTIAFILAFVFITFVVEAFVIPTGSMADTLRGTHFRLLCPACGYQFNFGFNSLTYGLPEGAVPPQPVPITTARFNPAGSPICPLCGALADPSAPRRVCNGDRILVLKFLYQFRDPQPWDVVVFKNPERPDQNYIKRLIALPGQTVQIIDGDVYIDGQILRKPEHVQQALWIRAYDSDYQPAGASRTALRKADVWDPPFAPEPAGAWRIDPPGRRLQFTGRDEPDLLPFSPARVRKFAQGFCAYNGQFSDDLSVASDLQLEFVLTPQASAGAATILLGKYDRLYRADVRFDGACTISDETPAGQITPNQYRPTPEPAGEVLDRMNVGPLAPGKPVPVSFAVVDHAWRLRVGERRLEKLGLDAPAAWGYPPKPRPSFPSVALAGQGGPFLLQQVRLSRDVYYTNQAGSQAGRGTERNPFQLAQDEFFVCGDNSPQSHDSRFWQDPGKGNSRSYRPGVVPRDYLIGRALFVYWPSGFTLHPRFPLALVPNVGSMRFIH